MPLRHLSSLPDPPGWLDPSFVGGVAERQAPSQWEGPGTEQPAFHSASSSNQAEALEMPNSSGHSHPEECLSRVDLEDVLHEA